MILKIIVIGISSVFFLLSYTHAKKERYRIAIWLLVAGGLSLRMLAALDPYLHQWDERFHALVGKNLIANPLKPTLYANPVLDYDYKNWMSNHVWLFKPPMALWFVALSLRLFGIHDFAVRIPSLIFGSLSIYLTYRIGKSMYDEKIGWVAAFLQAINGYLIDLSSGRTASDHVDTAFLFFVELGIFLSLQPQRGFRIATGIATGLAMITRYFPGLIVMPVWLALQWNRLPLRSLAIQCLLIVAVAFAVFLPWEMHSYFAFPQESQWVRHVNLSHLYESIDKHAGSFLFHFFRIPKYFGLFAYIGIGLYLWIGWKQQRNSFYAILVWFLLPYLFFSTIATKLPGYVMIAAPALFLMLADSWWYCKAQTGVVSRMLVLLLVLFPAIYCLQRLKVLEPLEARPSWAKEIDSLREKFDQSEKVVLFGTEHPIETMFYTPWVAYQFFPSADQEKKLLQEGYTVAVAENKTIAPNRPSERAVFVSQVVPESPLERGKTYTMSVTFKNVGAKAWESHPKYGPFYFLVYSSGTRDAQCVPAPNEWQASRVRLNLKDPVLPEASITFAVKVTAPEQPGVYSMRWRLRKISWLGTAQGMAPPTNPVCVTVR